MAGRSSSLSSGFLSRPWNLSGSTVHCSTFPAYATRWGALATAKTTTLTFRIEPGLKEALRVAAGREHRSIANMVEVLIRDYCGRNSIAIIEQQDRSVDKNSKRKAIKR
jgi:hypothetical protein